MWVDNNERLLAVAWWVILAEAVLTGLVLAAVLIRCLR